MHIVLRYLTLTVVFAGIAFRLRGGAWLLLWPALSSAALAAAYMGGSARWLGKRPDGSIHPASILVFLPYFAIVWSVLQVRRHLFPESAWSEVGSRLIVGRRPSADSLPRDIDLVVDCTAELVEPRSIVKSLSYRSFPILDQSIANDADFATLIRELTPYSGTIYLHCAAGKGRSATVAAALLLTRGLAKNPAEAESLIRDSRPQVGLHAAQRLQVARVVAQLADNQGEQRWPGGDRQGAHEN